MKAILRNYEIPIVLEGLPYIIVGFLLTLSSLSMGSLAAPLTFLFSVLTAFSLWFYRNPRRAGLNIEEPTLLSPADGKILSITEVEGNSIGLEKAKKISIFMSPLNVHVNRIPIQGIVKSIDYHCGKFFKANLDKASLENERNCVVLDSKYGRIAFIQIAGFIARRIVCYLNQGEQVKQGDRFGMIRFGSRMELIFPPTAAVLVHEGQKVYGGLTPLARL